MIMDSKCKECLENQGQMKYVVKLMELAKEEGKKSKEKEMLDDEIKFLEEQFKRVRAIRETVAGLSILQYPIQERLSNLKERKKEIK